jgi:hypothetical protein
MTGGGYCYRRRPCLRRTVCAPAGGQNAPLVRVMLWKEANRSTGWLAGSIDMCKSALEMAARRTPMHAIAMGFIWTDCRGALVVHLAARQPVGQTRGPSPIKNRAPAAVAAAVTPSPSHLIHRPAA